MSLKDIQYKEDYRSGYDNLVKDFFQPSLREAQKYWRAVGYFSSSALEVFGASLGEFIKRDGQIRLITSVELSEADLNAIENGAAREGICAQRLEKIIESDFADNVGDGVSRLTRLLEIDRLEIRIAVPNQGTGIYHEKIGLFMDGDDYVAFTGSSNESRTAFENNRECLDVYSSWNEASRATLKRRHFEALWDRTDEGVDVYDFPEAARKKLLRVCGEWEAERRQTQQDKRGCHQTEQDKRWRHQTEAMKKFLSAERGVLEMATGTGKTRTALMIMEALFKRDQIDTVIVCTEGNDLLDQWYKELLQACKNMGRNLRILRHYGSMKEAQSFELNPQDVILLVSRGPVATVLRNLDAGVAERALLIHDEVHGLGSEGNRKQLVGLSDNVRFRLGLSATPEREYDQEGNAFIETHIGPMLITFGLEEAIERGILSPFNYHPLSFELTEAERHRISTIYAGHEGRKKSGKPVKETDLWIQIARVYKTSSAKLPVFEDFIKSNQDLLDRCIIFTEEREYGQKVLDIVHQYRPAFHTYYSGEDADTLGKFARDELGCLITCHRLSEGIDIKSLTKVILFSSAKARLEMIQRIGRCLRTDPDNPEKIADIVDFIHDNRNNGNPSPDEERRDWLVALSRIRPTEQEK